MYEEHCRHWLPLASSAVTPVEGASALVLTISTQNLVDGFWYNIRLNQALPALTGTEQVFVNNAGTNIQLTDWRGRRILSERLEKGGDRLRMVYTQNGPNNLPIFVVREGIIPIP